MRKYLQPIYYFNSEELNNELPNIIEKYKKDINIDNPKHIWPKEEALSSQKLQDLINEF